MHNFTVSAQDILIFRRLSVFTVSFTGILQLLMLIMKRFVPSYWLVKWLWYRVYNPKVVSSSPRVCVFFLFYFIRFVLRPLRNEIFDHSISKGWCVTRKMSQSVRNVFRDYWKLLFHIIAKTYGFTSCLNLSSVGKRLKKSMQQVLALRQDRFFFKYLRLL